jgi:hypothetical protein
MTGCAANESRSLVPLSMPHKYKQSTGEWFLPDGKLLAVGYSGFGICMNRPDKQDVPHEGPICRGLWRIDKPAFKHPHLGPLTMLLIPFSTTVTYGRSLFRIHGYGKDDPKTQVDESKQSSHGCICEEHEARKIIAEHPDDILEVIE